MEGKARPTDILFYEWDSGRDLAVDLTVRHPLTASGQWDPRKCQLADAEAEKNHKYIVLCTSAGLDFIPLGMSTFGAFGPQGRTFLAKLFGRYAKRFGREQEERFLGQFQHQCWERLSVALHKAIGQQLSGVYTQLGGVGGTPCPRTPSMSSTRGWGPLMLSVRGFCLCVGACWSSSVLYSHFAGGIRLLYDFARLFSGFLGEFWN